jgi:uncharacterized membrane protein YesL
MFGFLVKKAFFDLWDNLFRIILMNLGYIAVVGLAILVPYGVSYLGFLPDPVQIVLAILIPAALVAVYSGAASHMCRAVSDYQEPGFRDFVGFLRETWVPSLLFALVNAAILFFLTVAMPFYLNMPARWIGAIAFAFLFWVAVIWAFSIQYFFPLQSRVNTDFRKNMRKIFLLFFDNTMFSIGLAIGFVAIVILSGFTAFMLPGIAAALLWHNEGLKLRMYKYDWLEANPGADRKKVPWDALLVEDKERVGKRTLRGMIFPWKE